MKSQRATRLERLRRLRQIGAPRYVIKADQINLVALRKGQKPSLRWPMIPQTKLQQDLVTRHITPLLDKGEDI